MQISTVTTKTHTVVFSGDEVKAALTNIARKGVGAADDAAASCDIAADGTVTVSGIVVQDAASDAPAEQPVAPPAPASPGIVPGFGKAG